MSASVVLASASPQRRRILADLGVEFEVRIAAIDELADGDPVDVAVANAVAKSRAVDSRPSELVIGCDTVVATEAGLWGKPRDEADALRTLEHLSGRTHRVVSGVAVVRRGELTTAAETTLVGFRELGAGEIARYVAGGEWRGRAGGYAIQGAGVTLVERVEGELANVIGLPVGALLRLVPELRPGRA